MKSNRKGRGKGIPRKERNRTKTNKIERMLEKETVEMAEEKKD